MTNRYLNLTPEENKERILKRRRENYANNKENFKDNKLKTRYGMSLDTFIAMVEKRQGKCDICGAFKGRELHVDHNHDNGKVRGLLCFNCNNGIGAFGDDPNLMSRAVNYLCLTYGGARDFVQFDKEKEAEEERNQFE